MKNKAMKGKPDIFDVSKKLTSKRLAAILITAASLVAFLSIWDYIRMGPRPMKNLSTVASTETLHIFVPGDQAKLVQKAVEVKIGMPERQKADMIMAELKKANAIPEGLKLYHIATGEDGTIYLNFSKELVDDKINAAREIAVTYAIVNSFIASFKETKKVQLLVEGQAVPTINGVVYVYRPIEPNKGLLED